MWSYVRSVNELSVTRPEMTFELLAYCFADSVLFEMAGTVVVLQLISLFFCCGKCLVKVW